MTIIPVSPEISMDKSYRTRDGRPVRLLCVDRKDTNYPVIGLILDHDGQETLETFKLRGGFVLRQGIDDRDLIETTPFDGLKIDQPIWVRDRETDSWLARHYAGNFAGKVLAWNDGGTSHSAYAKNSTRAWPTFSITKPL